jgi:thiamine kinase-like enzyme
MPQHEIEELCRAVVPGSGAVTIETLGTGLLSNTYRVARDGAVYTLKVAAARGLGLEADLDWEARLLERATAAGIAPPVANCDPTRKVLLTRWIVGRPWSNEDAADSTSLSRVAQLLHRVHALEIPQPPRRVSPAQWMATYTAALTRRNLDAGDPLLRALAAARVRQLSQIALAPSVVCHSDLHPLNLIEQNEALILLDWEYAHVADPFWDLAGWSANTDLAAESQWRLLTEYGGSSPASEDWQRLRLNLWLYDYVCLLWSRLYMGTGASGTAVAERARVLDARLRLPAHYAA